VQLTVDDTGVLWCFHDVKIFAGNTKRDLTVHYSTDNGKTWVRVSNVPDRDELYASQDTGTAIRKTAAAYARGYHVVCADSESTNDIVALFAGGWETQQTPRDLQTAGALNLSTSPDSWGRTDLTEGQTAVPFDKLDDQGWTGGGAFHTVAGGQFHFEFSSSTGTVNVAHPTGAGADVICQWGWQLIGTPTDTGNSEAIVRVVVEIGSNEGGVEARLGDNATAFYDVIAGTEIATLEHDNTLRTHWFVDCQSNGSYTIAYRLAGSSRWRVLASEGFSSLAPVPLPLVSPSALSTARPQSSP